MIGKECCLPCTTRYKIKHSGKKVVWRINGTYVMRMGLWFLKQ
jgi:hypothetical protein